MNRIRTKRRIVLTGTPLQNNLVECAFTYKQTKPNKLKLSVVELKLHFRKWWQKYVNGFSFNCILSCFRSLHGVFCETQFAGNSAWIWQQIHKPITNGQHADSTSRDVKIMKRRAHVLHEMLAGCVQVLYIFFLELIGFLPLSGYTSKTIIFVSRISLSISAGRNRSPCTLLIHGIVLSTRERITLWSPSCYHRSMNMSSQCDCLRYKWSCMKNICSWMWPMIRIIQTG